MESITLAPVEGYSGDMMNDSECLDTMVQMSMIDRSTSLSRILASKTSSTMLTTDPTMRSRDEILGGKSSKRSSGVLGRLFTKSGQSISEEERAARKQARALRRAQSLDFLSRDPRDSRRRFKSTTVLTKELFQILQGQTTTEFETASLSMDLNTPTSVAPEGTLESPSSPTLQDILEGQVGKDMLKVRAH